MGYRLYAATDDDNPGESELKRLNRELELARNEANFWKRQCEAQGRDLNKALKRLEALGEVPIP